MSVFRIRFGVAGVHVAFADGVRADEADCVEDDVVDGVGVSVTDSSWAEVADGLGVGSLTVCGSRSLMAWVSMLP